MPVNVGTLLVDVRFNTGDLGRRLEGELGRAGEGAGKAIDQSLSGRLSRLGTSLGNTGRQLSLGLTLPLVAFGRQAAQSFLGFDKAMTQVTALVGVSRAQTDLWRGDVKAVGSQYGVTATDAAQALYFITSSGVDAADAMSVLDTSAKASAVGLGTVQQTADVVTSAMNAYGKKNLSAAKAADILTVAVREGKGEASQMGGALSAVIPIASAVGVSFGEITGAMAAMTLSGQSPDEAATALRGILNTLQDMPPIAQRALKSYTGLDYATIRTNLSTKGLIPTLKQITDAFGNNQQAVAEVFGNVRALNGVYNLFGEKTEQTLSIVRQTTNAQGDLGRAFEDTAESASFKYQQARADIDAAMVDIGAIVVPIFAKAAQATGFFLTAISSLGPVAGGAVGSMAALAASAGPLLYVSGSVARLAGQVGLLDRALVKVALNAVITGSRGEAAMGSIALRARTAAAAVAGPLTAAFAAALVTLALVNHELNKYDEDWTRIQEASSQKTAGTTKFDDLQTRLRAANKIIGETQGELKTLDDQMNSLGHAPQKFFAGGALDLGNVARRKDLLNAGESAQKTADETGRLSQLTLALAGRYKITNDAALAFVQAQDQANHKVNTATEIIGLYDEAIRNHDPLVTAAVQKTAIQTVTFDGLIASVKETSDAFFGVTNAQKRYDDSLKAITDAKEKVTDAERDHANAVRSTESAQRRVAEAERQLTKSGQKLAESRQAAADAQKALNDALAGPSVDEKIDVESAKIALDEARANAREAGQSPLERRRSRLDVLRAQEELKRAQGAHDLKVADARKDVAAATESVNDAEAAQQEARQAVVDAEQARRDAQEKEQEALGKIGEAQDDVADAERNAVQPALDLATAQSALNTMFTTGTVEGYKFKDYLTKLKELYPDVAKELQGYLDKYAEFERAHPQVTPYGTGGIDYSGLDASSQQAPIDQPVGGDSAYSVTAPSLTPAPVTGQGLNLAPVGEGVIPVKGGDGFNVGDINVYETAGPRQTAYEVRRELRKESFLSGRRP